MIFANLIRKSPNFHYIEIYLLKVIDFTGKTVLKISRPCTCTSCCGCRLCCCGLFDDSKVLVKLADGDKTILGSVSESCHPFRPSYIVKNGDGKKELTIKGPSCAFFCSCKLRGNVEFKIKKFGEPTEHCGRISKEFEGIEVPRQHGSLATDADNYGISFPLEMDPRMKATLLGAILLIDFMYFEDDVKRVPRYEPPMSA